MAIARVVSFEGIDSDRMAQLRREMEGSEKPVDVTATEIVVLHDPEADTSLVIVFFENEDDYTRGDEALNAMPASDTPGKRTSVAISGRLMADSEPFHNEPCAGLGGDAGSVGPICLHIGPPCVLPRTAHRVPIDEAHCETSSKEPAFVARRRTLGKARVRLVGVRVVHAPRCGGAQLRPRCSRPSPGRSRSRAPTRARGTLASLGAENRVCPRGAVDEVPLPQRTFLTLNDQQRLAGQHEKVLLVRLPVVHRHRLARPEGDEVDAHLWELGLALEDAVGTSTLARTPACVSRIEDEPAVSLGREPMLGRFESRLLHHRRNLSTSNL